MDFSYLSNEIIIYIFVYMDIYVGLVCCYMYKIFVYNVFLDLNGFCVIRIKCSGRRIID